MNTKFTAYALNELPPDERAELEAQMKSDPTLRKQAEEMKAFCAMLADEVAGDEATLTTAQRVSVMRAFTSESQEKHIVRPFWRQPAFLLPTALAACVAFALVKLGGDRSEAPAQPSERVVVLADKRAHKPSAPTSASPVAGKPVEQPAAVAKAMEAPLPALPLPILPGTAGEGLIAGNRSMVAPEGTLSLGDGSSVAPSLLTPPMDRLHASADDITLDPPLAWRGTIAGAKDGDAIGGGVLADSFLVETTMPSDFTGGGRKFNLDVRYGDKRQDFGLSVGQPATVYGALAFRGNMPASAGSAKSGAGTLDLNGTNTYTGGTIVSSGGTLQVNTAEALAVGQTVAGSTINTLTLGNSSITGSGDVAVNGAGAMPESQMSLGAGKLKLDVSQAAASSFDRSGGIAHPAAPATPAVVTASPQAANPTPLIVNSSGAARSLGSVSSTATPAPVADAMPAKKAELSVAVGGDSNHAFRGMLAKDGAGNVPTSGGRATTVAPAASSKPIAAAAPVTRYSLDVAGVAVSEAMPKESKFLSEVQMQSEAEVRLQQLQKVREEETLRRSKQRESAGETYTRIYENPFLFVAQQPLSTFSIDVDTASYANVRRFLNEGQRPPADAVRLEELINYFPYSYEGPSDGKPFGVMVDVAEAPWQPMHRLVRVALKGREVKEERGAANFVFLVDVSGSMDQPDKLPLVQRSLEMLTRQLGGNDRVALVVYAGNSGLVLPSTTGNNKETILDAIGNLKAGGSTNGAGGIRLAYEQAAKHFIKGGVNRVILCTDGDFNVGISTPEELEKLIAEKAKSRVFLSVLGFGTGNLKDRTMETLADKGNGNYAYIDSLSEARKVLVEQMNGTLVTIAKDVKIQVEFNPAQVAAYRLLGYENRILAKEDFNNDKKDAGEIGAGHTVTALYEIVPSSVKFPDGKPIVDDLKYAVTTPKPAAPPAPSLEPQAAPSNELMTVKLRYKQPEGDKSDLLEVPVTDKEKKLADSPRDFQFAASVAGFGMLLRGSQHAGELTWDMVRDLALRGKGEDTLGYRGEFLQLIDKARGLTERRE